MTVKRKKNHDLDNIKVFEYNAKTILDSIKWSEQKYVVCILFVVILTQQYDTYSAFLVYFIF